MSTLKGWNFLIFLFFDPFHSESAIDIPEKIEHNKVRTHRRGLHEI